LLHLSSIIVRVEINNNSNRERRLRLEEIASTATEFIEIEEEQFLRADELQKLSFRFFDALHLACAEAAGSDVFLTTDDQLLRLAFRVKEQLNVRVINPASWLMEVITNDERNDG